MYRIGQLAKMTNLSIRTLRYYDEIGLLKPALVTESGYRYYAKEEIRVLRHIIAMKELGFNLTSIKELLSAGQEVEENRWRNYLDIELAKIAEEKKRLLEMEKLLMTTRYAFEMNGGIETEDILLFIRALQSPPGLREDFLARNFTEREAGIINNLPKLDENDPRSLEWARLIRQVKDHLHEPPSSAVSRQLAARIIELVMEWFQQDERLIDKYWSMIRPEEGETANVFGLDTKVMAHIDRIVDWYLQHVEGDDGYGG
ncbi:MerR family transcriptional regulator [Paenibacillus aurantiacus]|uniref:MerR family transcriptional regulator n=1 Tax=Paenibacillus aurantiacus TaxID=1936118 RepID=A0ABV5KM91_9BACL